MYRNKPITQAKLQLACTLKESFKILPTMKRDENFGCYPLLLLTAIKMLNVLKMPLYYSARPD